MPAWDSHDGMDQARKLVSRSGFPHPGALAECHAGRRGGQGGERDRVALRGARRGTSPRRRRLPTSEPTTLHEVDRMAGPVVLEFGAEWCGYCQALRPTLDELLRSHPEVRHVRVEDGPGRVLGRSFRVKLWPTLVFLRD